MCLVLCCFSEEQLNGRPTLADFCFPALREFVKYFVTVVLEGPRIIIVSLMPIISSVATVLTNPRRLNTKKSHSLRKLPLTKEGLLYDTWCHVSCFSRFQLNVNCISLLRYEII